MGYRDYTEHFSERLRYELGRSRDCIIKTAVSGWSINAIAEDFEWSVSQYRPHVFSLNVGMNDCTAGPEGVCAFGSAYRDVLKRLLAEKPETTLVIHTPTVIVEEPGCTRNHLALYAEEVRKIAIEFDAILVDNAKDWKVAKESQRLWYWLSDAFHPNEYGHRVMAHSLLKAVGLFDANSIIGRLLVP
jgi:lysophospholipase L1-like esterase